MLGAIADGNDDGMPLAVVCVFCPDVVDAVGATIRLVGSQSDVVKVPTGATLVTPFSVPVRVVVVVGSSLDEVMVGGTLVSGGAVLLPVGTELLPEMLVEVITGGSVTEDVVLVPGSTIVVPVLRGGSVVPVPVGMLVLFVIGGCPVSVLDDKVPGGVVSVTTGGSVTLVAVPVPGPVIPLDVMVEVVVGSKMLVRIELMSLRTELSGLSGSLVVDELVTMPVGAIMISDELDKVTTGFSEVEDDVGTSSEVAVGAASLEVLGGDGTTELLVSVVSSAFELVSLLDVTSSLDEGSGVGALVLLLEMVVLSSVVASGALELDDEVSDEDSDDEVSADEADDEVSDEEDDDEVSVEVSVELSVEVSVVELLSAELSGVSVEAVESVVVVAGVWAGGVTTIVLVKTMVVTPGSLGLSESDPDCLLVVSVELGSRLSSDVIVELVTCRLTWRGK